MQPMYQLAELVCRGGLSDQQIKKETFVRIEKLSFWESPVKISDVAGTPNGYTYSMQFTFAFKIFAEILEHTISGALQTWAQV